MDKSQLRSPFNGLYSISFLNLIILKGDYDIPFEKRLMYFYGTNNFFNSIFTSAVLPLTRMPPF